MLTIPPPLAAHPPMARRDGATHLFAAFVGLAVFMAVARLSILNLTYEYKPFLPLMIYQDIMVCALAAWLFHFLLKLTAAPMLRRIVLSAGWIGCLLIAVFTAINVILYDDIRSPLTYPLLVMSHNTRGVEASMFAAVPLAAIYIFAAVATLMSVSELLWRRMPALSAAAHRWFYSPAAIVVMLAYFAGAHFWASYYLRYPLAAENAEWAFLSSLAETEHPAITSGRIPRRYFRDFRLSRGRAGAAVAIPALARMTPHRPINVVMIVMESVGTRRLGLYGAPYNDSPEIVRLARHAIVFQRIYAAQANTSDAIAALFCSLYPGHGWETVPRRLPALAVPALPTILVHHGYRTGFIHSGQLSYDNDGEFLSKHGIGYVFSERHDYDAPRDAELPAMVSQWIKSDPSKPFFLTVWTQDTHHPYVEPAAHNFDARNQWLNHYLNGVRATDEIVGQIATRLKELKLADNTLLIVTGDHGEAFGDHGQTVHGFTVYEEEVRIPLLIINPAIPREVDINRMGRQIDIAPTILSILGYRAPSEWQGIGLFARTGPQRAYLFSADGNFSLGLVEGSFKYIYDFNRNRAELYNLTTDPNEKDDLSSDSAYAARMAQYHLRLEAWLSFQNSYLDRLASPYSGANAESSTVTRIHREDHNHASPRVVRSDLITPDSGG